MTYLKSSATPSAQPISGKTSAAPRDLRLLRNQRPQLLFIKQTTKSKHPSKVSRYKDALSVSQSFALIGPGCPACCEAFTLHAISGPSNLRDGRLHPHAVAPGLRMRGSQREGRSYVWKRNRRPRRGAEGSRVIRSTGHESPINQEGITTSEMNARRVLGSWVFLTHVSDS